MVKTRRSAEKEHFWRNTLQEQADSGLSVRAFCIRENLSEASFYAWRREIQERDGEKENPADDLASLIPVTVIDAHQKGAAGVEAEMIEVVTPSGYTLRVGRRTEPETLASLLRVISDVVPHHDNGVASC